MTTPPIAPEETPHAAVRMNTIEADTPINVLLLENVHAAGEEILRNHGFSIERMAGAPGESDLIEQLQDVHILGIRSKTHITADILKHAPNLISIGCFCIGTNQVDLDAALHRGIAVFNAPFSSTRSVAELTLSETIALHRRLPEKSARLHQGKWEKSASQAHEVRGRTLGIVGYGHIGSQLSILAEALGMNVLFYDIATKLPLGNARAAETLEELLRESDCVTLHVPATELTKNLIGREQLDLMKPGSLLINNSRGSVVDLDALHDALEAQRLGGAAIDVYPVEPHSNDETFECPLAGLRNVILTPHVGGSTEEAQEMIAGEVASKIARFVTNGSTSTSVNVPEVDLPKLHPDQHRILHFHRNVPGVLSKMHKLLADLDVNISGEFLQSNTDVSYVILDIDPKHKDAVREKLHTIDETIRVRTLD